MLNKVAPASAVTIQLTSATTLMTASLSTKVPALGCHAAAAGSLAREATVGSPVAGLPRMVLAGIDRWSQPQGHGGWLHDLFGHGQQLGRQGAQVDLLLRRPVKAVILWAAS